MDTSMDGRKALIRRFGEAMNSRRPDLLDAIVAPGFVRHCQATPETEVKSLDDFKEYLRRDAAVFPDSVQTVEHVLAEGDLAAIWGRYEGTQRGPMGIFPPTGRKMRIDFAAFLRIEHGKIAEMWVTWDNVAALAQLGHIPPPPGGGA